MSHWAYQGRLSQHGTRHGTRHATQKFRAIRRSWFLPGSAHGETKWIKWIQWQKVPWVVMTRWPVMRRTRWIYWVWAEYDEHFWDFRALRSFSLYLCSLWHGFPRWRIRKGSIDVHRRPPGRTGSEAADIQQHVIFIERAGSLLAVPVDGWHEQVDLSRSRCAGAQVQEG